MREMYINSKSITASWTSELFKSRGTAFVAVVPEILPLSLLRTVASGEGNQLRGNVTTLLDGSDAPRPIRAFSGSQTFALAFTATCALCSLAAACERTPKQPRNLSSGKIRPVHILGAGTPLILAPLSLMGWTDSATPMACRR